jgi:2-succinyl-6-hydroxy-2,4-cyclohexadiene-1-carboxylate synthase
MARIDLGGINLNVERAGAGPPVVLLHGFTGSAATWRPLVEVLAPAFTTLSVDLVGHGESDAPAELEHYRMRPAVDDLAALLRAQGFERATWLGYSLGGRVALQVGVHRPDVVSSLVLEGATPGLADEAERAARVRADEELADRIERDGLEWFADYWGALPLWDSQRETLSEEQRAALRRQRLAQRPVGLANSLRGMGTGAMEPVHGRLQEVEAPVMLITGALDAKFTEIAGEMAQTLRDVTMAQVAGAGHAAHLERPGQFAALVLDFLRRIHQPLTQPGWRKA